MKAIRDGHWILAPGTLCTHDVFDPVMSRLGIARNRRRTLEIGLPSAADYRQPLEELVAMDDIACGFSLGSLVLAHNLASLAGVRAIVLISLNPFPDDPGNDTVRRAMRDRVKAGDVRGWVEDNWQMMSTDTGSEIRNRVVSMAEQTASLINAQTELAISRPGAELDLTETRLPLVFVTGELDQMTPPAPVVRIADTAPRAHVRVLSGLGHFALLEAPDRVAAAINEGLRAVLEGA